MVSVRAINFDQMLQEIVEAAEDKPQPLHVERANDLFVERMVRQCYALLCQELERKVKLEPDLYSKDAMDRVLHRFKVAMPDIQDAILTRVKESVSELVRQEISRLLQDALSDLQDAIMEPSPPPPRKETSRTPYFTRVFGPKLLEETYPAPERDNNGSTPEQRSDPPERPEDIPREHAVPPPSPAPSSSAVVEREDQDADTSPDAGGSEQQSSGTDGDKAYQGTVKVSVDAHGDVGQMMHFMNQLSSNAELQLRQLTGTTYDTVTLLLGLRRPLHLRDVFSKMESVSEVTTRPDRASQGWAPTLHVVLKRDPVLAGRLTDN